MKYKLFFFVIVFFTCFKYVFSQCDVDALADKCVAQITEYKYIKAFNASSKKEFQYVFSKNHKYLLSITDDAASKSKMKVTLYDRNHKQIASNYSKQKYYSSFSYMCSATGVYYIEISFEKGEGCGVAVLAFKN